MRIAYVRRQQTRMTRRLLACYARATQPDIAAGLDWYPRNAAGCERWASSMGLSRDTVACVIAALSPQCRWEDNLRIALQLLTGQPVTLGQGALKANVRTARRVLADRAVSLDRYFIEGPKVKAFARNLQGYADAVTIDTHAAEAAAGHVRTVPRIGRQTHYDVYANAYRAAALAAGLRPCDFQAVVWHVWKREHPPAEKRNIRRHAPRL